MTGTAPLQEKEKELRGIYIARLDAGDPHHTGVMRKINAQIHALSDRLGPVESWFIRDLSIERNGEEFFRRRPGIFSRQRIHIWDFYNVVSQSMSSADYFYIRHQRATPVFINLLKSIRRSHPGCPIIVEVPTWPYDAEQLNVRDRALGVVDRHYQLKLKPLLDRVVTFSSRSKVFGVPTVRTDNGVRIEGLSVLPAAKAGGQVNFVGVANLGDRHAYDRIIDGIADYRDRGGTRSVTFHIIGKGAEEGFLRARTAERNLCDRVHFLGMLTGGELDRAMEKCQLGVSALGLHRSKAETSDIKSREYCARGLPFVISNRDNDFGPTFPFAFHAPMTNEPVDVSAAIEFLDELASARPDYPAAMRAYAENTLSWTAKMAPVVAEIRALAAQR